MSGRWFSGRHGYSPRDSLQIEDLDEAARNRIWNVFSGTMFTGLEGLYWSSLSYYKQRYMNSLAHEYLAWTFDNLHGGTGGHIYRRLFGYVQTAPWHRIYGLMEASIEFCEYDNTIKAFTEQMNKVLTEESCGYRIVGKHVVRLTSDEEIEEVEKAIATPFDPINAHITKAMQLLSDRTNPDYPNSIKESISAVECVCQIIVGRRGVALNRALNQLEDSGVEINDVLKRGFRQLYGWTSSDDGIRHAMMDLPTVDQDDARFMLVTCSAFVNYLIAEGSKAGIDLASNYENIILNA